MTRRFEQCPQSAGCPPTTPKLYTDVQEATRESSKLAQFIDTQVELHQEKPRFLNEEAEESVVLACTLQVARRLIVTKRRRPP